VEVLTYEFNTLNGLPTTLADRQNSALRLVDQGVKPERVAELLRIKVDSVRKAMARRAADHRLESIGIIGRTIDSLPLGVRERINQIENDNVLRVAVKAIVASTDRSDAVATLVRTVKDERTEGAQIAAVQKWLEEFGVKKQVSAGSDIVPTPQAVVSFTRGMSTVQGVTPEQLEYAFDRLPRETVALVLAQMDVTAAHLRAVSRRLARYKSPVS
jgi:hypothetical protein